MLLSGIASAREIKSLAGHPVMPYDIEQIQTCMSGFIHRSEPIQSRSGKYPANNLLRSLLSEHPAEQVTTAVTKPCDS
jgi:hypothetical protein